MNKYTKIVEDMMESNNPIKYLYTQYPDIETSTLDEIYSSSVSIFQSNKARHGKNLEISIEKVLEEENIPFTKQASISECGTLIKNRNNTSKEEKCFRVDFLVGENIQYGEKISNHLIVSCKTSLRERGEQEATIHKIPYVFFLVTRTKEKIKDKDVILLSTKDAIYNIDFLIEFIKKCYDSNGRRTSADKNSLLKNYHKSKSSKMSDRQLAHHKDIDQLVHLIEQGQI